MRRRPPQPPSLRAIWDGYRYGMAVILVAALDGFAEAAAAMLARLRTEIRDLPLTRPEHAWMAEDLSREVAPLEQHVAVLQRWRAAGVAWLGRVR